jgi:glucose/arabinose dehydrogenase
MPRLFALPLCFLVTLFFGGANDAPAATFPPGFSETRIAHDLRSPSGLAVAPDGRVFILQQEGVVRMVKGDTLLPQPFLTVPNMSFLWERGLMGIALDPRFDSTGHVYLFHTAELPVKHNRVIRVTAVGDTASLASLEVIAEFPPLPARGGSDVSWWHMGGGLEFGADGKLYVALGDHETAAAAPDLESVFGKVLRFNSDGTIPDDNPYFATAIGQNRAIWARGLRSPFTMAMKRGTSRLFVADVGGSSWEEVNEILAGKHYGWNLWEGASTSSDHVDPLYTFSRDEGCSVIGGDFYTPDSLRFPPWFKGHYFVTDFCGGWIRRIDPDSGKVHDFAQGLSYPTGLRIGRDGNLYYILRDHQTGNIQTRGMAYRVTSDSAWPAVEPVPQPPAPPEEDTTSVNLRSAVAARNGEIQTGLLVGIGARQALVVPAQARGLRITDLTGRSVWSADGLHPGRRIELPAHVVRGVLRYRWVP